MATTLHYVAGFIRGEIKELGTTGVSFSIPVDKSYKNKEGEKVEKCTWYNFKAWGKTADMIKLYCNPGEYHGFHCDFDVEEDQEGRRYPTFKVHRVDFGPRLDKEESEKTPF